MLFPPAKFLPQFLLLFLFRLVSSDTFDNDVKNCDLPPNLKEEIAGYAPIAEKIIRAVTEGEHKGTTYDRLAKFIDKFGNRMSGSVNLENAIDYMLDESVEHQLENVHGEPVLVPHWIRCKESAEMTRPRRQKLAILGLGGSVSTPRKGLHRDVLVVDSFDELKERRREVPGKIVVFNQKYEGYEKTVEYRYFGAAEAAKLGAAAALIKSLTPFSLYTPHTGWQFYEDGVRKIPVASITVEDSHMLKRMQDRGENVAVLLKMNAHTLADVQSRNTVAEIQGRFSPEKVVIVSGHLDSWDVGQGAMDDGAGAFLSWNSLVVLKALGLRPRRTLRAVLWTGEEVGLVGASAYLKEHKKELDDLDFIMESDAGTFNPLGLDYAGPGFGACILQEVLRHLAPINATQLKWSPKVGSDISIWIEEGIPGAELLNENEKYFWYHHTNADTMDVEDPEVLDRCTALWAVTSYIMADLSFAIPKNLTSTC